MFRTATLGAERAWSPAIAGAGESVALRRAAGASRQPVPTKTSTNSTIVPYFYDLSNLDISHRLSRYRLIKAAEFF